MKEVKNLLRFNDYVFCGALRYAKNETSDATSAKLANYFKTDFINLTDVKGLYDKNPRDSKKAKLIQNISYKKFSNMSKKMKFKPGQHFVLDQQAATIIKSHKIKTYILGPDLINLNNLLNNKSFTGTTIK